MTKQQTQLIKEAARIDLDGEGWRDRMNRWADACIPLPLSAYWADFGEVRIHLTRDTYLVSGGKIIEHVATRYV